jgi:hypothetical protein
MECARPGFLEARGRREYRGGDRAGARARVDDADERRVPAPARGGRGVAGPVAAAPSPRGATSADGSQLAARVRHGDRRLRALCSRAGVGTARTRAEHRRRWHRRARLLVGALRRSSAAPARDRRRRRLGVGPGRARGVTGRWRARRSGVDAADRRVACGDGGRRAGRSRRRSARRRHGGRAGSCRRAVLRDRRHLDQGGDTGRSSSPSSSGTPLEHGCSSSATSWVAHSPLPVWRPCSRTRCRSWRERSSSTSLCPPVGSAGCVCLHSPPSWPGRSCSQGRPTAPALNRLRERRRRTRARGAPRSRSPMPQSGV